jgi:hypothetical protein
MYIKYMSYTQRYDQKDIQDGSISPTDLNTNPDLHSVCLDIVSIHTQFYLYVTNKVNTITTSKLFSNCEVI